MFNSFSSFPFEKIFTPLGYSSPEFKTQEVDNRYIYEIAAPGVKKSDIKAMIKNSCLNLTFPKFVGEDEWIIKIGVSEKKVVSVKVENGVITVILEPDFGSGKTITIE